MSLLGLVRVTGIVIYTFLWYLSLVKHKGMSAFNPPSRNDNVEKREKRRKENPAVNHFKSSWHLSERTLTKRRIIRILLYCELRVPSTVCITLQAGRRRERKGNTIQMKKSTRNLILHFSLFAEALNGSPADHSAQNELRNDLLKRPT